MIIFKEFKEQFYNKILEAQNVVIVPHNDVDSLCATFILTRLFEADGIMYSVTPVTDWNQLKVVFDEHGSATNHFVLLNCGGFRSLVEFELPSSYRVFVLDARRPFNLDNIYDEEVVKVLCQESELNDLNFPQPSEVFRDDDESNSDEEEDEDEENHRVRSVAERIERGLLKRKQKENWHKKRDEILWNYNHKSYISTPTSVFVLKIAHSMSKTNAASTWSAAVGLSSFHADHSISTTTYSTLCIEAMKPHLRQFGPTERSKTDPTLRISFEKELTLPLYRHWSLDESIRLDVFFICACRLWTQRGRDRLKSVYATLGIPLTECLNSFDKLDTVRRKEVCDILNKYMKTNFGTFFSHKGYARWFSSSDFARAIALRLQFSDPMKSHTEMFASALNFLRDFVDQNGGSSGSMNDALKQYKSALASLTQLTYDCVLQKRFIQTPSFIGLTITQHCTELDYLRSPHCLNIFIYIALRVFHGTKRSDKRLLKPLFVAVLNPMQTEQMPLGAEKMQYYLCSGSMPLGDILSDPEHKTYIPRIFDELSEDETLNLIYDSIDPNVILVREDSYAEFFSRLDSRLPSLG